MFAPRLLELGDLLPRKALGAHQYLAVMGSLIFVDCEAVGGCPAIGKLTEFGAVAYPGRQWFHGVLARSVPSDANPAVPLVLGATLGFGHGDHVSEPLWIFELDDPRLVWIQFNDWLASVSKGRPIFVSDNPAFDWQWINDGFWRFLGQNPFGHSARRISDFYAGLCSDFYKTQQWKSLRVTPHDHNPVHDALGNLEAFERLLAGER